MAKEKYPEATSDSKNAVMSKLKESPQSFLQLITSTRLPLELLNATIYALTKDGLIRYSKMNYAINGG